MWPPSPAADAVGAGAPASCRSASTRLTVASPGSGAVSMAREAALSGRRKVKREPWPSSDSRSIVPPCNSTSWRVMARPRPVPPCSRMVEPSPCEKESKMLPKRSRAIPGPVSATVTSSQRSRDVAETSTAPAGVNLMALPTRLNRICCTRSSSASTRATCGSIRLNRCSWRRPTSVRDTVRTSSARACRSVGRRRSSMRSWRSLEKSSRSLTRLPSRRPLATIIARLLRCSSLRVPVAPSSIDWPIPMMPFSGVRSSCEVLARNSSFRALARSIACSACLRTVTSRMMPVKSRRPPAPTSLRASSMGNRLPSARIASSSRPMPMTRASPVAR